MTCTFSEVAPGEDSEVDDDAGFEPLENQLRFFGSSSVGEVDSMSKSLLPRSSDTPVMSINSLRRSVKTSCCVKIWYCHYYPATTPAEVWSLLRPGFSPRHPLLSCVSPPHLQAGNTRTSNILTRGNENNGASGEAILCSTVQNPSDSTRQCADSFRLTTSQFKLQVELSSVTINW